MRTFVVPDVHGRFSALEALLTTAGVIDAEGERIREREFTTAGHFEPFEVVSIGDLLNGTLADQSGDEECLLKAQDWFDKLILGNHESGYIFANMGFNGYWASPAIKSLYNKLYRDGFIVPAALVGDTLLSHAGVHAYFEFESAAEAHEAILDVWNDYSQYRDDYSQKFYFGQVEIPKALLLDAVAKARGGSAPFGGILWSDWSEPKSAYFNQVVGHTPVKIGPIVTRYMGAGISHVNIDCSAKSGLVPTGLWLDAEGQIDSYVTAS